MNSITELLNLKDADIFISDIPISGTQKIQTIEAKPETHFCPICDFKSNAGKPMDVRFELNKLIDRYQQFTCIIFLLIRLFSFCPC